MAIRVGINGFGRIGRLVFRCLMERPKLFEVVGINDITDTKTLAYLLKYDSIHRRYPGEVGHDQENIIVDGKKIKAMADQGPGHAPLEGAGGGRGAGEHGHFHRRAAARASPATPLTWMQAPRRSSSAPRPRTSPT